MAAVESQMLELGTIAPAFSLPDPDGNRHSLADGADAYVVMFICNHCPFVKHIREELARIGRDYGKRNVAIYAINSNDIDKYPADGPVEMKREAETHGRKRCPRMAIATDLRGYHPPTRRVRPNDT